jgi:hypothetical protein
MPCWAQQVAAWLALPWPGQSGRQSGHSLSGTWLDQATPTNKLMSKHFKPLAQNWWIE